MLRHVQLGLSFGVCCVLQPYSISARYGNCDLQVRAKVDRFDFGTSWKWEVNFTLRLLYLRERAPVPIA
jgi:hypothetical protein